MTRIRTAVRIAPLAFLLVPLALLAGCSSYQPLAPPADRLPRDVELVDEGSYLALRPETLPMGGADHGIIFYPGGLVEPEAYVSLLAPLASDGIPVAILRVPADLAVLSPNRARRVLDAEFGASARSWSIAGHSLGGAMGARFVARNRDDAPAVHGLILLASYPAASDSLAGSDVPVLSIWAENDGLATAEDRAETAERLPADAEVVVIEGANHAGFGEYGPQDDDGPLEISRETQHEATREYIVGFLSGL